MLLQRTAAAPTYIPVDFGFSPTELLTAQAPFEQPIAVLHAPTAPSVVPLHDGRDRVKARFRLLRRLHANHDNESAAAPDRSTIDRALAFLDNISSFEGQCFATLNDAGEAVIEFEDRQNGYFADITFRVTGDVECYRRSPARPSAFHEGPPDSVETRRFLAREAGIL